MQSTTRDPDVTNKNYDYGLIVVSLVVVAAIIVGLTVSPEQGSAIADRAFAAITYVFGTPTLVFALASFAFLLWLAFSKYGDIRLGQEGPDFSTKSWVGMILTAGLGSATVYWAFLEWAYYYQTPGLGVAARSDDAYAWSLAYNFFHWGLSAWSLYCIAVLPIAYHLYVRKHSGFRLSSVVAAITGIRQRGPLGKLVDLIFIFTCIGGLSVTLGLSIPLLSEGVAGVFGWQNSFMIDLAIVALISVSFSLSSYLGIEKGVRRVTNFNSILAILFLVALFVLGPSKFIVDNSVNALGIMLQNFVTMSLWTSPIQGSDFPESWTIFYWLYWITYTPFMGVFVARISRGRRIKEVIINMLVSGSLGCWVFFGVLENYSMDAHLHGLVDVVGEMASSSGNVAILQVLGTLPMANLFVLFFVVLSMLFLISTLDSASYTLAVTASKELRNGQDPSASHRLFWCLMVVVVPMAMIFVDAPLNTIKTAAIMTAVPLSAILLLMCYGMVRWMREDYGLHSREQILVEARAPVTPALAT